MRRYFPILAAGLMLTVAPQSILSAAQTPPATMPGGWQAQDVQPVGFIQLEGKRIFKLALREVNGRFYLFAADGADETPMGAIQVVDVTDVNKPKKVASIDIPYGNGQVTLKGNLLIAGQQQPFSQPSQGGSAQYPFKGLPVSQNDLATLVDISNPLKPRKLSTWNTAGWATHRNSYPGGKYAFMSGWVAGYRGQSVLVILDVSDPAHPREAGRWWQPGQAENEAVANPAPGFHGPVNISADGKMLTLGYTPSFLNLDISDPAKPKVVGKLDFAPLAPIGTQAIHTVVPLKNGYYYLSTEPGDPGCETESLPFAAIVDNRKPESPRLVSYLPRPQPPKGAPYRSFCEKEGRFGPHNVNTEMQESAVQQPGNLIFQTYFNAGLRVIDATLPHDPREVGWFLPQIGPWNEKKRGPEDVIVDRRGYIFTSMGREKSIWILKYIGDSKN